MYVQQDSMYLRTFRINKPVSLVVCINDDFHPEGQLEGSVKVYLEGRFNKPIRNLSGNFVFTDLENGQYTLCVDSLYYFHHSQSVYITEGSYLVVYIMLKPNVHYPFERNDTLLRGKVVDSQGGGICNVSVRAVVSSPISRVAQNVQTGDRMIPVVGNWGRIQAGDIVLIGDEYCTIEKLESVIPFKWYSIEKELEFGCIQGTGVLSTVSTTTGINGEFVVYFRSAPSKGFDVKLEVAGTVKEFEVFEGKTSYVGGVIKV